MMAADGDVWSCYDHLPVQTMTVEEVMRQAQPGSGLSWDEELRFLWTEDHYDTHHLTFEVASDGAVQQPIVIGPDGRLWDGHHRLAAALALNIKVPTRVLPPQFYLKESE